MNYRNPTETQQAIDRLEGIVKLQGEQIVHLRKYMRELAEIIAEHGSLGLNKALEDASLDD